MRKPGWDRPRILIALLVLLPTLAIAEAAPSHESGFKRQSAAPWVVHIRRMDEALARKDSGAAEVAWHDAYVAALISQRWEGLITVGDALLRIGTAKGREASETKARSIYLDALFRARQQRSLEGVLRSAEAFAVLSDWEVVRQCLRIAEGLAVQARDAQARARVQAFRERLAAMVLEAKSPGIDPF